MVSKKAILKVKNVSDTDSVGSEGARDNPSRTTARSQAGTLTRAAGLMLKVPLSKWTTEWCLPKGPSLNGAWKAVIADMYGKTPRDEF